MLTRVTRVRLDRFDDPSHPFAAGRRCRIADLIGWGPGSVMIRIRQPALQSPKVWGACSTSVPMRESMREPMRESMRESMRWRRPRRYSVVPRSGGGRAAALATGQARPGHMGIVAKSAMYFGDTECSKGLGQGH